MEIITSRRELLKLSLKGAGCVAAAALLTQLSSCKKAAPSGQNDDIQAKNDDVAQCPEQALTDQERSVRLSLQYVDASPLKARNCNNCKIYTIATQGSVCGGCKIVPGPIHPQGYCAAWIARM